MPYWQYVFKYNGCFSKEINITLINAAKGLLSFRKPDVDKNNAWSWDEQIINRCGGEFHS